MDSATLAKQIAAYDAAPVTSTSALNEALGQFGVPEIRKTVSGLRSTVANTSAALDNVDPSVTGRTQGSLVTEAQRQKQVVNERAPIAGQLTKFSGALSDNERALQDALGQATTVASNRVNDYTRGRDALQSQYESAYTREKDAAAKAEADRQYQLQVQQARSSSASSSATKQADMSSAASKLDSALKTKLGRDGFASPYDYNAAKSAWVQDGFGAAQFDGIFGKYKNPKQPKGQYQ